MSCYSGKLEDISLRIPQWWAPSHPSRHKQTALKQRRNEIEDLQNRKQASPASSASWVVTESFDVVCERNDVAGNFEGTLDWNATFVKSLFNWFRQFGMQPFMRLILATVDSLKSGNASCAFTGRHVVLSGSGKGCQPVEVRNVGPVQSWSMAVICKYADGRNNVPSVVGHLAFWFHAHAEIILPGFCLWRPLGLWMEGASRLELLLVNTRSSLTKLLDSRPGVVRCCCWPPTWKANG